MPKKQDFEPASTGAILQQQSKVQAERQREADAKLDPYNEEAKPDTSGEYVLGSDMFDAEEDGMPRLVAKRGDPLPGEFSEQEEEFKESGLLVPARALMENQEGNVDRPFLSFSASEREALELKLQAEANDDKLAKSNEETDKRAEALRLGRRFSAGG